MAGSILCGDFNAEAGFNDGYRQMTHQSGFTDSYYMVNPLGLTDTTIGGMRDGYKKRIDYLLVDDDSSLQINIAQRIFTEDAYGRVSDHNGQYGHFSKREWLREQQDGGPLKYKIYLAGSFSGNRPYSGFQFHYLGDGQYQLTAQFPVGEHDIFLTDLLLSVDKMWGAQSAQWEPAVPLTLSVQSNQKMTLSVDKISRFRFLLDASNSAAPVISYQPLR